MADKFDPAPHDKHAVDPKKAIQADKRPNELEEGLEDTFPASDPCKRDATQGIQGLTVDVE
jgi:hypothetical protein